MWPEVSQLERGWSPGRRNRPSTRTDMSTDDAVEHHTHSAPRGRVRVLGALGGLVLMGCVAACGGGTDTAAPVTAASSTTNRVPTGLTCTGLIVSTAGGLFAGSIPDGYKTREAAVDAWLAHAPRRYSRDYVISSNGRVAWLLRKDGTAEAKLRFLRHRGFAVHGYEACA